MVCRNRRPWACDVVKLKSSVSCLTGWASRTWAGPLQVQSIHKADRQNLFPRPNRTRSILPDSTIHHEYTMRTSTCLAILTIFTCASAYPFMAEYNQLNDAQKRAVTDMAKKNLLPRGAAAYCGLIVPRLPCILILRSFRVPVRRRENRRASGKSDRQPISTCNRRRRAPIPRPPAWCLSRTVPGTQRRCQSRFFKP